MRILCIWFPHWPLQRVIVAHPELKGRPVVLSEPHPRGGERVAYASRAAYALGVRAGMSMAEAVTLVGSGERGQGTGDRGWKSGLGLGIAHDPLADREDLIRLAHWCHRFSPTVGLEEGERPESLLLDVAGIGRLFGGEDRLLEQAAQSLSSRGYRPRLALAHTIGAAWALAHFQTPKSQISNLQSEICNLKSLPLAALRLPKKTIDLLAQLGIMRIEQLAALPRDQLECRFGPLLLRRLDQALGTADEVFQPVHPPPELAAGQFFETPTSEPEILQGVIEQLLGRLTGGLAARGEGATQLICRFDLQDGPPLVLDVGLYRPTATVKHLHELIRMQLEQARLKGPVENIALTILAVQPLAERQQELFDNPSRADSTLLARWIDRVAGRLGHWGVVRPRLVRDAQPELAIRYEPLVGAKRIPPPRERGSRSTRGSKAKGGSSGKTREDAPRFQPLQRPLQLLPRPVPIRVISLLPDGPPAQFVYRGRTYRVTRHWGPERIETGWWRKVSVCRDYWRTETAGGSRYWLFRRLHDRAWFLHGIF